MRVSGEEVFRVAQLRPDENQYAAASGGRYDLAVATGITRLVPAEGLGPYTANPLDVHRVVDSMDGVPDVREDVVASLRARIEAGTYSVTGEQIAEMLVRRFFADRVR